MSEVESGTELPEVRLTPDRYVTVRYAGASGDFNPIHIDDEFARQVGLPGKILHGLWTMAQVARAVTQAAAGDPDAAAGAGGGPGGAGGGPESLRRLEVDFRGLAVPEQEIVIEATVAGVEAGVATVTATARQGSTRIVRNATAEVVLDPAAGPAPQVSSS